MALITMEIEPVFNEWERICPVGFQVDSSPRANLRGRHTPFKKFLTSKELLETLAPSLDVVPNFSNESQWCT